MIHSLAGGKIRDLAMADFAKVEILDGTLTGAIRWYIFDILDLKISDLVLVPVGLKNETCTAKVLKIERNLSAQVSPIPIKSAKSIIRKIK